MLPSLAPAGSGMYMLCSTNPTSLYNITLIQEAVGNKKQNLLFAHSVTGCDTTSALFGLGKKKAIDFLDQYNNENSLDVFISGSPRKETISNVGEKFILKLYGAQKGVEKLDKHRYIAYNKTIRRSSLSSAFKLKSLPPTSRAAHFHVMRTYLQVQQWVGCVLEPTEWGWYVEDGMLKPIKSDQAVAPDTLLKKITCGCDTDKGNCGRACSCRKLSLLCGPGCKCTESEQNCSNAPCHNTGIEELESRNQ